MVHDIRAFEGYSAVEYRAKTAFGMINLRRMMVRSRIVVPFYLVLGAADPPIVQVQGACIMGIYSL